MNTTLLLAVAGFTLCGPAFAAPGNSPDGVIRGSMLTGTIRSGSPAGDNTAMKGVVISLGAALDKHICYDADLLRVAVAWGGGYLEFGNGQREIQHPQPPQVRGVPIFYTKVGPGWARGGDFTDPRISRQGPLPRDWAKYKGLYRRGDEVILNYTVGDTAVLEMPSVIHLPGGGTAIARTFNLGPSSEALTLLVASFPPVDASGVDRANRSGATLNVSGGAAPFQLATRVQNSPANSLLRASADQITLTLPASTVPTRFTVVVATAAAGGDTFGAVAPAELQPQDLASVRAGGPARWGAPVVTQAESGTNSGPYIVDTLTAPYSNPWNARLFFGGFDFLPDGRIVVGCFHGDVYVVNGAQDPAGKLSWKRFATGLFQPLGVKVVDGGIYVTCRDALVRLMDVNNDGEADYYEAFNNDTVVTPNYHEFCLDLHTDADGNFYYAKGAAWPAEAQSPHQGTMIKVSKDGSKMEIVATGLRAPNGSGLGPNGWLTVSDNQGHWIPASKLNLIKPGGFYGMVPTLQREGKFRRGGTNLTFNPSDPKTRAAMKLRVVDTGTELLPEAYDQPICWLPMSMDNSSGGQTWVTSDKWGPYAGRMLFSSYGKGTLFMVMTQTVDDTVQAAMWRFPLRFRSGTMRLRFSPRDGQLYTTGLRGWQSDGQRDGALQRVRYTGQPVVWPTEFRVRTGGLEIQFPVDLDPQVSSDPASWSVEQWNYRYSGGYGSPEFWPSDPRRSGHEPVAVIGARLLPDQRTVILDIPTIQPVNQIRVRCSIKSADGTLISQDIYGTIHKVPAK